MNAKSIYRKIYILLILVGAMGIVTYYADKLVGNDGHIIIDLIVLQIIYNTLAATAIVKMLKKQNN